MQPYNSLTKKIRGWKRRIRQLDQWGKKIEQPYVKHFLSENGRNTYDRCYLSPFYRLDKRQPPLWFYKLIINKFIKAYYLWDQTFKELGVPYDLQLWLYDPAYISAQIVCYKLQKDNEIIKFAWESAMKKEFPYNKFMVPGYDLTQFDWILADDEVVYFEDDYTEFTPEDLLVYGFEKKEQNDGVIYYAKRVGDIWIGRLRGKVNQHSKSVPQGYYPPPKFP